LGGRGILYTDDDTFVPFWFSSFQSEYAVGVQSISSGDISKRGFLWGAGSAFNKDIFKSFIDNGLNFNLSCRKGDELTSGGDAEYCCWFLLAGYKLWYDENLVYLHYITNERLTKDYLIKLISGTSSSSNEILITYRNLIMDIKSKLDKYTKLKRIIKYSLMLITFTMKWEDCRFNIQRIFPLSKFLVYDKSYYSIYKVFYFIRKRNQTIFS
jgi:hypothetical protein